MKSKDTDTLGPVVFTIGKYRYMGEKGDVPCSVKATFKKDPEGCRGFGNTEAQAETMLRKYAAM